MGVNSLSARCSWKRVNLKTLPNFEEKLKELQQENGSVENLLHEVEKRKIKVSHKKQLIFEIPMPAKDEKMVQDVVTSKTR